MIQEVMTRLEQMNLVEKFLFDETMEDKEAYEAMVSILLEDEEQLLPWTETEKELRVSPELRSIRLDVVSMDEKMWRPLIYSVRDYIGILLWGLVLNVRSFVCRTEL